MSARQAFIASAVFLLISLAIYYFGSEAYGLRFGVCFSPQALLGVTRCDWPASLHFSFKIGLLLAASSLLYGLRKSNS